MSITEKELDNRLTQRESNEGKYKNLNKEQREAVLAVEGPVLILAGAGSGKTTVLVNRIVHIIKDLKVYPSQILAITFTNKAAGEMKQRVEAFIGPETGNMWVSTFHSSCVRILRREIDKLGYNKNFAIYDTYDQKALVKDCMSELDINDRDITEKEIINKIGSQKDNLKTPEMFKRENEGNYRENKIADVFVLYQKKLKNNNALDFDDIINKTVQLFLENKDVLEFYQRKFKYVMVDEYQDTNKAQYELVRLLSSAHKNICVVGDDDQCIYEWRGADIRNILDFEKDYPEAKVIKLEQNYRSKGNILKAANDVIKHNSERKNKVLRTDSEEGCKINIFRAFSDVAEGDFTASEIKRIIKNEGKNYKDFVILYRTNAQSRIFEDSFIKWDIPYRILGGLKFYDRKEIKDIMAYLKIVNNPLDDVSLKRIINVPKRNIGDSTIVKDRKSVV
jgi:DNA helicase II / ATP-dependent DNA helicase PcrA